MNAKCEYIPAAYTILNSFIRYAMQGVRSSLSTSL